MLELRHAEDAIFVAKLIYCGNYEDPTNWPNEVMYPGKLIACELSTSYN